MFSKDINKDSERTRGYDLWGAAEDTRFVQHGGDWGMILLLSTVFSWGGMGTEVSIYLGYSQATGECLKAVSEKVLIGY